MNLVAAEIRKLTTVRTTWVLTLVGVLLVGVSVGFLVFEQEFTGVFSGTDAEVGSAIGQIAGNSVIVLVVAIMLITTEFRNGTIGRTLQLVPSRSRVLLGKLVVGFLYGVAFFVVGLVVVTPFVLFGADTLELGSATVDAIWQCIVALGLTAILGVALGALIRSQVVAVTVSLVWVFVVEPLVNAFFPAVGRWFPFQLLNALFVTEEMVEMGMGMSAPVDTTVALVLFLGYTAVAAIAAGLLMRYRDV